MSHRLISSDFSANRKNGSLVATARLQAKPVKVSLARRVLDAVKAIARIFP